MKIRSKIDDIHLLQIENAIIFLLRCRCTSKAFYEFYPKKKKSVQTNLLNYIKVIFGVGLSGGVQVETLPLQVLSRQSIFLSLLANQFGTQQKTPPASDTNYINLVACSIDHFLFELTQFRLLPNQITVNCLRTVNRQIISNYDSGIYNLHTV